MRFRLVTYQGPRLTRTRVKPEPAGNLFRLS